MEITKTIEGTKLTIALAGRLDNSNASSVLEPAIAESIKGITELVFDLAKLEYVSSAGLRCFLTTMKTMSKKGSMKLIHANDIVKEVFDMTGFSTIMDIS